MARNQGVFDFSSNFEVKIVAPLDARTKVSTKADLYSQQMVDSYPYAGMIVAVAEDVDANNGIYYLSKLPCIDVNWVKIGSSAGFVSAVYNDGTLTLTRGDGTSQAIPIVLAEANKRVVDMTLTGTNLTLWYNDGTSIIKDLNLLQLSGTQFQTGITTHDFIKYTESSFTAMSFNLVFPNASNETIFYRQMAFTDLKAKETTVVIDINTLNGGYHHILGLPKISEIDAPLSVGKKLKVFVKRNNISNKDKHFMLGTTWVNNGTENRLLSVSSATKSGTFGYFLPMELMEVVELFWDGEDWVALTRNNEKYVAMDALDFTQPVTDYVTTR